MTRALTGFAIRADARLRGAGAIAAHMTDDERVKVAAWFEGGAAK